MKNRSKRQTGYKHGEDTSPVPPSARCAKADAVKAKPVCQLRGENTGDRPGRMSAHSVFVLGVDGKPLMPTTPETVKTASWISSQFITRSGDSSVA